MEPISLEEQLKEIRREIAVRQRVYPGWILEGRITKTLADLRIATLEAIAQTIRMAMEDNAAPASKDAA